MLICQKRRVLRCPNCDWPFEVEILDNLHPYCSTQKPKETSVDGGIIEKVYDCNNPKCRNPVYVYFYKTKGFFKALN